MAFIATPRCDLIEALWLLDGPINGERFRTYVEKVLVPTLQPGDLVIIDNLSSHKGEAIRHTIRDAGGKVFLLPKYSHDLNRIEKIFSKLKHLLRKTAAQTADGVCDAISQILNTYTAEECTNYLENSGYVRS